LYLSLFLIYILIKIHHVSISDHYFDKCYKTGINRAHKKISAHKYCINIISIYWNSWVPSWSKLLLTLIFILLCRRHHLTLRKTTLFFVSANMMRASGCVRLIVNHRHVSVVCAHKPCNKRSIGPWQVIPSFLSPSFSTLFPVDVEYSKPETSCLSSLWYTEEGKGYKTPCR